MQKARQIYATIRPESKYNNQNRHDDAGNVIPFPVKLAFDTDPFWPIKGGIGDNYTLFDVDLWASTGEKLERIMVHNREDVSIPLSRIGGAA